ncbi:hypothetical protein FPZ12_008095 [Amycolatopsis acidicola]|uniref:Uncharacterized protein n=1 Tax=Amycolatopsis acidicola TaxID=2596893 RepID=A0A5N0VGM1_9PSEU|nr:hypothetical protein [Amycolatopsis acidicola]KAA9163981.1 hypothetical protein FPZ12_008095 [Amycolatopsis acidicola]
MNLADVDDAASLLRFALVPKQRPTPDSPYRSLLDRYRTDAEFAEIVTRIAGGLGLRVHLPTQLGLLLTGTQDGPFALTLDNSGLPRRTGPKQLQDRYCFGLVLVGLAAYAYPNGEALIDSGSPSVRITELQRFITRHAKDAAEEVDDAGDAQSRQLGAAAKLWCDLPDVSAKDSGRDRDNRRYCVQALLRYLTENGRADARRRWTTTAGPRTSSTTGSGSASPKSRRTPCSRCSLRRAEPARRCRRMYRLRRFSLDSIGVPDNRFSDLLVDLTDAEGAPADSIVWLRNGAGKTTMLSLLLALILPDRRDFLATRTKKSARSRIWSRAATPHTWSRSGSIPTIASC